MQRNKIVLSKRVKLALVSIVLVSVLVGTIIALQSPLTENPPSDQENGQQSENHLSVIYRGFVPDTYNASIPDYYMCINDLAGDTMTMKLYMEVKNQESSDYYIKTNHAGGYHPPGWSFSQENYTGGAMIYVRVDETEYFHIVLTRDRPSSILEGRLTETLNLTVQAFYDKDYQNFYDEDFFNVTFHFIDRTSPFWTVLYYDNFDDGTNQGWSAGSGSGARTTYYRSWRYSFYAKYYGGTNYGAWPQKTFYVPDSYTEAYAIIPWRNPGGAGTPFVGVYLNNTQYFGPDVANPSSSPDWFQATFPIWIGYTRVALRFTTNFCYIDDIYVIAK